MEIDIQKQRMRNQMLFKRAQLGKKEKQKYDHWVCQKLWDIINEHKYQNVHCFLPMGEEIDILPLIEKMLCEKIVVISPKTLPNRQLENLVLNSLHDLEKGVFGTRHPANSNKFQGQYDLIIVPGLAFDNSNNRLGYGGGYYDSFLSQHPQTYQLGIAYSFQKVEQVPSEFHDVKLDDVLFV